MKILLFSGSHPRHLYVHQKIIDHGYDCRAIIMEREDLIPEINENDSTLNEIDINNFRYHFKERLRIENSYFGELDPLNVYKSVKSLYCKKTELNSKKTIKFIQDYDPEICIVFGSGILNNELIENLPEDTINMHLGLSPNYRGSATLFWPFYNLEPQFAGVTFHKVSNRVDAGGILHQVTPKMEHGDGIHRLSSKAVIDASDELIKLIEFRLNHDWKYIKQKSTGKLFLSSDFKPHHLRVIYNLYNNNLVDEYLNNNLPQKKPELIKILS